MEHFVDQVKRTSRSTLFDECSFTKVWYPNRRVALQLVETLIPEGITETTNTMVNIKELNGRQIIFVTDVFSGVKISVKPKFASR